MVICIAEDRASEEIALKLLLLSLARHCPGTHVVLSYPPASSDFAQWVTGKITQCELHTSRFSKNSSWNVKADMLLRLLEEGHSEVWWLDSDIIVDGNFVERYMKVPSGTLVACEEALYGSYRDHGIRARCWNLPVARSLPFSLNTGVLRVSGQHIELLKAWSALLDDDQYRAAQKKIW